MPAPMSLAKRKKYHKARYTEGLNRADATRKAGVGINWSIDEDKRVRKGEVERLDLRKSNSGTRGSTRALSLAMAGLDPPPRYPSDWTKDAARASEDFHFFCERYLGIVTTPWRRAAFARLYPLWKLPTREYVVVNAPPGSGKSQLFMHDFCVWLTVRDRRIRGLHGSATARLATRYTKRVRNTLTRKRPLSAGAQELEQGLACDAVATLIDDYGRFRSPEQGQMWQYDQFEVEQLDGLDTGQKEPTWQSYGRDSDQLGNRVNIVVWDDLVTRKTLASTISEEFVTWFTDEAETRIDPGGLFVLQGQRLDANDLYRNRLDVATIDIDEAGNEVAEKQYHHITFPAHFDDDCNEEHGLDAPYAEFDENGEHIPTSGCLLEPKRLPWRFLRSKAASNQRNYDVIYQQRDVSIGSKLVSNTWIVGGMEDGVEYKGCTDLERDALQFPEHLAHNAISAASVDPSGVNSWAVEWWLNEPDYDIDHLMALHKGPMAADDLLSYNPAVGEFYGMMDMWQKRSEQMRKPIIAWVVEVNAAQRYLLQHEFVRQWMQMHSVMIIPHQTHRFNKADSELGFWAMRNQFKWGKCRLPYAPRSNAFTMSRKLVDEALRWPSRYSDDALMAYWMYRLNLPKIRPDVFDYRPASTPAPSWLR